MYAIVPERWIVRQTGHVRLSTGLHRQGVWNRYVNATWPASDEDTIEVDEQENTHVDFGVVINLPYLMQNKETWKQKANIMRVS